MFNVHRIFDFTYTSYLTFKNETEVENAVTKENWFSMCTETDCFQIINLKKPVIYLLFCELNSSNRKAIAMILRQYQN